MRRLTLLRLVMPLCMATIPADAADRPDILLIMADDMGFSDIGCYGSEINTPSLDMLAANGLRFAQFYNAARCCPTRAALLTGLYPHQAGVGKMITHAPAKKPSPTQGYLNNNCATVAEILKPAGYRCYMSGKWHVGEFRPAWPIDRGFDKYYGLISGGMNYFDITKAKKKGLQRVFARDGERLMPGGAGFYTTDAFTDEALSMLQNHQQNNADDPLFLYLAFNAPHWPLHAPDELIARYEGRYMDGWDVLRNQRYQRMLKMRMIHPDWKLSPADGSQWNELPDDHKRDMDRRMAVYAAMIERMDWNIGRVIDFLRQAGRLDNTLVMFLSDNGACHEGGLLGGDFRKDLTGPTGTEDSYRTYGQSWSNAGNTPFRKHKHWTHEGGISTPLIVHWPNGLKTKPGSIVGQVGHVIDLVPTFCDVSGAEYPTKRNGSPVTPAAGQSLLPTLRGEGSTERTIYWEHMGNAAIRKGKWKLVKSKNKTWELYDLAADRSELNDVAAEKSERVKHLRHEWQIWAQTVGAQ
jgi:arylsulfatase A-like enzyme